MLGYCRPRRGVALKAVLIVIGLLLSGAVDPASAGIRSTGKYSGVVFFDRWDTCLLISGPYVMYISENVKNELREYAGVAVQIDALDVFQPMNPGDGLIRKYQIIGLAPELHHPGKFDGLDFQVKDGFGQDGSPVVVITVTKHGSGTAGIDNSEVGVTLLANHKSPFSPSDGPSEAVITRMSLEHSEGDSFWRRGNANFYVRSKVEGLPMPDHFVLKAGESREFRIRLDISPGEYQFMVGYGGGVHEERSVISNAISFDIAASGKAIVVK